jgi:hypothetical protein
VLASSATSNLEDGCQRLKCQIETGGVLLGGVEPGAESGDLRGYCIEGLLRSALPSGGLCGQCLAMSGRRGPPLDWQLDPGEAASLLR